MAKDSRPSKRTIQTPAATSPTMSGKKDLNRIQVTETTKTKIGGRGARWMWFKNVSATDVIRFNFDGDFKADYCTLNPGDSLPMPLPIQENEVLYLQTDKSKTAFIELIIWG